MKRVASRSRIYGVAAMSLWEKIYLGFIVANFMAFALALAGACWYETQGRDER